MATNKWSSSSINDKQKSFVNALNHDHKYSNINLNQNYKCSTFSSAHSNSKSKSNNNKFASSENFKGRESPKSWRKLPDQNSTTFIPLKTHDEAEENVKNQWKKHPLNPTKSTLSLHIAAYENLNEDNVKSSDENEGLKINLGEFDLAKKWKTVKQLFTGLPLDIKISFEIPRQQNEGQSNDPQIMQFKASQKLLNPNQSSSSNKSHRKNKRGSKRSYFQSQQTSDINSANWRAPSSSSSTDMAHLKLNNKSSAFHGSAEDQQKEGDLQTFEHWGENGVPAVADDTQVSRGGWSVEEMFRKNQSLGVQTTYKDDLTQYTTCPAEGSKEDRARAAKIAKEIEACEKSKAMSFLENDDEERDLDKETAIPDDNVKTDITNDTTTSPSKNSCEVSQSDLPNEPMQASESESSVSSSKKFNFNPDAPTFCPRMQQRPNIPLVTYAQPQYITPQQFSQGGYATHIPQSLTNTLPPGYILTTQGVGMQHNPNMIQPTFIPQQIQYVPTGVPIYNPQIVTSSQGGGGGGYSSFIQQQPQTFVVRSNYDLTNGGGSGYIQTNHHHQPPQQLQQLQYAAMPIQYQAPPPLPQSLQHQPQHLQQQQQHHHLPQQQQQQFQPQQLPYSQQPPPNGLRRYGPPPNGYGRYGAN